ncbi:twin-arginine translocation signal domain-containing protein [Thioalkalivibrio sp. XN8]|uniref:twin-arginine translocation signal domain-containing protein n=1 Tax=Thioalkalivibrio sp. XN8 TaxID=2712863 RepID=UPI0013EDAD9F|nr:twin-arginine translocation signal domain-containing protein [Thioalkalivibrio sp. XN8]NGP54019.1 twin-arginine translocation signal domain-containing protein [Thioalkalivibrio sp. XN8]
MSLKAKAETNGRRRFLKGIAMAGGATAVAMATGNAVAAPVVEAPVSKPEPSKGYHETPHIRTYYQRARI